MGYFWPSPRHRPLSHVLGRGRHPQWVEIERDGVEGRDAGAGPVLQRGDDAVVAAVELVANARRSCARAPWRDLERDFDRCLERIGDRMKIQGS